MPHTVRLHRVLATRPEKVYRAFLEADALAKWLPPNGFACTVHHLEPSIGGTFKMSFRKPEPWPRIGRRAKHTIISARSSNRSGSHLMRTASAARNATCFRP